MNPIRLHLGAGPIRLPSPWINVDISPGHAPDVLADYTRLDEHFSENTADVLFCCHSLEHLAFADGVRAALAQMFRVMKPGGVARIVVPDLMLVAQKYCRGEDLRDIFVGPGHYHLGDIDCAATRFAFFCRAWDHTVLFDERLLGQMMRDAGFVNVAKWPFGVSTTPELRGLDRFEAESLSMEGTKP